MFTDEEIAYIKSQPLVRIATVSAEGQPDVAPVGFEFDGSHFYVGGIDLVNTRKFRNVRAGHENVALVIDDLVATRPWTPRFLRVYGAAEPIERDGMLGAGSYLRITPGVSWSWNLDGHPITDTGAAESARVLRTEHAPAA